MEELTLNGTKGLELTREEVIDLIFNTKAVMRKAQCREVNQDVIEGLNEAVGLLGAVETTLAQILEGNYEG